MDLGNVVSKQSSVHDVEFRGFNNEFFNGKANQRIDLNLSGVYVMIRMDLNTLKAASFLRRPPLTGLKKPGPLGAWLVDIANLGENS